MISCSCDLLGSGKAGGHQWEEGKQCLAAGSACGVPEEEEGKEGKEWRTRREEEWAGYSLEGRNSRKRAAGVGKQTPDHLPLRLDWRDPGHCYKCPEGCRGGCGLGYGGLVKLSNTAISAASDWSRAQVKGITSRLEAWETIPEII